MKKVLFATTALVMTAGVAAAEVAVWGDGRLGLRYESDTSYTADSSYNVINRLRVRFRLTGESDSGISFGGNLRSDQAASAGDNASATSGDVWVSGAYGKLTVGDVDAALEKAVGDLPEVGLSGLDYWNEFAYGTSSEADGDASMLYEYSIGNANLYASFSDGYYGNGADERDTQSWSLGVGYDLGNYTFGIGYEKSDYTVNPFSIEQDDGTITTVFGDLGNAADSESWGISGGTSISGVTFKAAYIDTSSDNENWDSTQYGVGAGYEMANGVGLSAFYRKTEFDNVNVEGRAFGLGASYDLGGGAVVKGGIVDTDANFADMNYDNTLADFGLAFTF
ncbi:porin [Paracoccus albus]|uniref:porin n=1 Tax=Paracoccus albus TaxID=3017784 RepID=UPI0022F0087D|nr:porin [Paracoccus albus]WBU60279.1 porin [Paracoccus albus]